jgi:hypothetical protein
MSSRQPLEGVIARPWCDPACRVDGGYRPWAAWPEASGGGPLADVNAVRLRREFDCEQTPRGRGASRGRFRRVWGHRLRGDKPRAGQCVAELISVFPPALAAVLPVLRPPVVGLEHP